MLKLNRVCGNDDHQTNLVLLLADDVDDGVDDDAAPVDDVGRDVPARVPHALVKL